MRTNKLGYLKWGSNREFKKTGEQYWELQPQEPIDRISFNPITDKLACNFR